jgi:hypothetical protein
MKTLPLDKIRIDGDTQMRARMDDAVIVDYREALVGGAKFPPVVVFFDSEDHWLADGFYRVAAHKRAGLNAIEADVREGKLRDAKLYAAGANADHGLRRSNADKTRAVRMLLEDGQWRKKTDRWIANKAAVSPTFVGKVREKFDAEVARRTATASGPDVSAADTSNGNRDEKAPQVSTVDTCRDGAAGPSDGKAEAAAPATRIGRDGKAYKSKPNPRKATPAPAAQEAPATEANGTAPKELVYLDALGEPVPGRLQAVFGEVTRFLEAVALLGEVSVLIGTLADTDAGVVLRDELRKGPKNSLKVVLRNLQTLQRYVLDSAPHAACPFCKAEDRTPACHYCKGCGWMVKALYELAAAKKAKEVPT